MLFQGLKNSMKANITLSSIASETSHPPPFFYNAIKLEIMKKPNNNKQMIN
jgi:hypothetical protein